MTLLKLTQAEKKRIGRVFLISLLASGIIVGGTWTFNIVQLKRASLETKKASNPFNSKEVLPFDVEAHRILASKYMQNGSPEKAIPHLERIIALNNRDFSSLLELATASLEAGNYPEALEYYDMLAEKRSPDSIGATECARRGIALFYLGRTEESRNALAECLNRYPYSAEALCFLGQIEASQDINSEKVVAYFNRAIASDSLYAEARYQLARYYMDLKMYVKARELLASTIEINPFHSKSHSRLGMAYYYMEYPELARKSYRTALILNPGDFNTRYNLAELLLNSFNDTIGALQEYKKSLELSSALGDAAFKIGLICLKNNMNKEAVTYFEQALTTSPKDIRILLQCATGWEKLGRKDNAAEMYRTILSIDELNAIARQKLKLLSQGQSAGYK